MTSKLTVDFAGELFELEPGDSFMMGREGDLEIDDNPYLHRHFLSIDHQHGVWWLRNVGSRLAAHLTDHRGLMRSTLSPGAQTPLVFERTVLTFAAGATTYELWLEMETPTGYTSAAEDFIGGSGDTTIGGTTFTESQLQAILALAEPVLRRAGTGAAAIPSAVDAAKRLGWTQTRFNRKLDNICDKLDQVGVTGLRGGPGSQAANRRLRLVEYAVACLIVTVDDLALLDQPTQSTAPAGDDA